MRYAELHCKTNFSFLEGASHAKELILRAAEFGYDALAITDRNTLAGMVRAHAAAKEVGLKLIVGAEVTPIDAPAVVLWSIDRKGYGQLCRLITVGRRRAPKGQCDLTFEDIAEHSQGLLAGIAASSCAQNENQTISHYRDVFGDRCYLLAELHNGPDDERRLDECIRLSKATNIPLAAAGDVHFHTPARLPLQHVLTCIHHGVTLAEAGSLLFPNASRALQPLAQVAAKFKAAPDIVQRTVEISDRCTFNMNELRYEYPLELAPDGMEPIDYLKELTWQGADHRYPEGVPEKVRELLKHELKLIEKLKYEAFFLTVYDAVRFARTGEREIESAGRRFARSDYEILCQGRGSAANSAVCFCLGIASVDPKRTEVLFERFISEERNEAPDIDVDFEHERREEVLQYLYEKYGRERAGIAATVITYRPRSAVRDVSKVLGLSQDKIDALAKNVGSHWASPEQLPKACKESGIDPNSAIGQRLVHLVSELLGFPRHLSQHVGGMVMTRGPLCELVPIENAAMENRTVVEWDKDDLEELGILKVDCLSLGMLTAIRKCFDLVHQQTGKRWTLATIPEADEAVYDMICAADVIGCFQIESRAQMSMLPRLKPRCYYDLVVEVAIVRPGPIQGGMVHPYLKARDAGKALYPSEHIRNLLGKVLDKTLGVPIFQEQVMQLAMKAANFSPGEADQLRRAMGAWGKKGHIDHFQEKLLDGMKQSGLPQEFADQIFQMIKGFGEYGFPESHSASFALLAYASAWLKYHYPAAFTTALLNSQPMGFYAPSQLIQDARRHDIKVLPIDVNYSDWDCTLNDLNTIRLGFRLSKGFPQQAACTIMRCREDGPFDSIDEFVERTKLTRAIVVRLSEADAFGSLEVSRRQAYWSALSLEESRQPMPLLESADNNDEPPTDLPRRSLWHEVCDDYSVTGLTLRKHPMSFFREQLQSKKVLCTCELEKQKNGQTVRVAGIVTGRQRPMTAKGVTFVTLEDETGFANLVIFKPAWDQYSNIFRHSNAWLVTGKLQHESDVTHVLVHQVADFTPELYGLHTASRDFH
ncbi:MAG: error-prone DNA polymerase [Planctomycetales bacterium]|nr:error-prone DNA polymerase [Planctomycetales bacterium]